MKPLFVIAALMAAVSVASAVDLPDPMRPPAAVMRATAVRNGQSGGAPVAALSASEAASGAASAKPRAPARNLRVSAVMLADAPGRDAALIDGRVQYVGDKLGGGVLMRIDAAGVTLREASGKTARLPLFGRADPGAPEPAAEAASVTSSTGATAPGKEQP